MVLRPSVGSSIPEPHARLHEKGNDDELLLKNLKGYSEHEVQKQFLDTVGISLERTVAREIDLQSHPDPDGSLRYVRDIGRVYRRANGEWVQVSLVTSEINRNINGKVSNELIPRSRYAWEPGTLGASGAEATNDRALRMKTSYPITVGKTYTLSDDSPQNSAIDTIRLLQYEGSEFKKLDIIQRGGNLTFEAVGTSFRIAFTNINNNFVRDYYLDDDEPRILTQLVLGYGRSATTLDQTQYATKRYVEEHTPNLDDVEIPDQTAIYGGGRNMLDYSRSKETSSTSGQNYVTILQGGLPNGDYVISFRYEIIDEVNPIDGFRVYQSRQIPDLVPTETLNGRTYLRFSITDVNQTANYIGLFLYAGHDANHANPNHVIFRDIMVEPGSVASNEYRPGEAGPFTDIATINPNLVPLSTTEWEDGGIGTTTGNNNSVQASIRLKASHPIRVEKGKTYTLVNNSDPASNVRNVHVITYDNDEWVGTSGWHVVDPGNQATFVAEGDSIRLQATPDGSNINLRDLNGPDQTIRFHMEEGSEVTNDTVLTKHQENEINRLDTRINDIKGRDAAYLTEYKHLVTGTDNWTDALEAALEDVDTVHIPAGYYELTRNIRLKSGQSVIGAGRGTKILAKSLYVFNPSGTLGTEYKIAETPKYRHGTELILESTSGLKRGDWLLIRSARNCLNNESAGDDWFLGSGTGTTLAAQQRLPFGEYVCIESVDGNTVHFHEGLVYPYYETAEDVADDPYPARAFSSATKVDFAEDIYIGNFHIDKQRSNGGFVLNASRCRNVVMENVHFNNESYTKGQAGLARLNYSLDSEVRNSSYYVPSDRDPAQYYHLNVFRITSSQRCGYRNCTAENAAQSLDISFHPSYMPATACYITDSTIINASSTGITTHAGNYLTRITGNIISGAGQGIGTRGRGGLISNNTLTGSSRNRNRNYSYGIGTYQGGSADTIITDNIIRGFSRGYQHLDEGASNRRIAFSGTLVQGNTISECNQPVNIFRMWTGGVILEYMGIRIDNNLIKMQNAYNIEAKSAIFVGRLSAGVKVSRNVIRGLKGSPFDDDGKRRNNFTGVTFEGDNENCQVVENTFIDLDRAIYHYGALSSANYYPNGMNFFHKDNEYIDVRLSNRIYSTVKQSENIF